MLLFLTMPNAIFQSVYAVSSEDATHKASNLLKMQAGKKWKTKDQGEKSAFVILQLETPQKITGIDVGNEHSAFVGILVGKTGCSSQDDFKEILFTFSVMTPIESKNSSNTNRVRCFGKDGLIDSIAEEKWDLIKVVCTQPFNKHVQYGLSFVTIHAADSVAIKSTEKALVPERYLPRKTSTDSNSNSNILNQSKLLAGKFKIRDDDSPDSESESSSSLFNRWKMARFKKPTNETVSTAVAIRAASSPSALLKDRESLKPQKITKRSFSSKSSVDDGNTSSALDRNRNDLLFGIDDDEPNEKLEKKISADREKIKNDSENSKKDNRRQKEETKPSTSKPYKSGDEDNGAKFKKDTNLTPVNKKSEKTSVSVKKRPSSPTHREAKKIKTKNEFVYKPFNKLLEGVTLAISGIKNPDRADLRNLALSMGAKYRPDWDSNCTHLICAFKNTPKYNQVKDDHGKIITQKWIEKCHSSKKRLPWRRYALDKKEQEKPESDEEIHEISMKPASPEPELKVSGCTFRSSPASSRESKDDEVLAYYDLGDDDRNDAITHSQIISSDSDTEDEILKVKKLTTPTNSPKTKEVPKSTNNIFEVSTDEEEHTKARKSKTKNELNFYKDKKFFINAKIGAVDKIKLDQFIKQFHGDFSKTLISADYVISKESISVSSEFHGEIVTPLWVYECNDMGCFIPTTRYLV